MDRTIKPILLKSLMRKKNMKKGAQPNDDEGHLPVEGYSSLLQSILDRFDGLQTYVGERFDALELCFMIA